MRITRLPIRTVVIPSGDMLFVMSDVEVPEKPGHNILRVKTVLDPDRPLAHKPGEPIPTGAARLKAIYDQIVEEQTISIDRARDAYEGSSFR